ncbi:glycosyltransferase [Thermodesulforhabdus norvegica]|uniref:Glycosyltransferase involved in cell wall bisynthesis n=1 Tax=Thermodesulforhabdus norvegica TaxID=39841 RepID=A0A1I4UYS6_9BACT|nr:glycosyltransferase [Thermodesulforhabdus norvegica]SFM94139.1 Glycosyltransferase involved in cell wall bisynthesis [Thermodesulforhabdus norvegica]
MKIALLGSRGIPASYSGFETFYENLAVRLVRKGHDVTVYNRTGYVTYRRSYYKGVRLIRFPSIKSKHLDTISHTFISTLHALKEKFDIYYFCIAGNSPVALMAKILGGVVVLNVDGSDADREKWETGAKAYIRFAERISGKSAHAVIADSHAVKRLYREHYKTPTVYIPYGANPWHRDREKGNTEVLKRFGLEHDGYILFVSRMTPENKADLLVKAFKKARTNLKLVLVGDAPYADDYRRYLDDLCAKDPRIVRTGYLWKDDYRQISSHCRFFVLPSTINGTRPVLLDQMAFANCVVVANNPAQQEVVRDCGVYFDKDLAEDSLAEKIELLTHDSNLVMACRDKAFRRASRVYSWDRITKTYEALFRKLTRSHR